MSLMTGRGRPVRAAMSGVEISIERMERTVSMVFLRMMERKVMTYNGVLQRIYYGQMDTEVGVTDTNYEDTDGEEEDYASSDMEQ